MKINDYFGIKYPFIQGGMANIATAEFAAAVSNSGGLGLIGAGGMNSEELRENIRKCRSLTENPFGVNLMLMHPEADEMAEVIVDENVKIVTTGAGSPGKYMEKWKCAGITVIPVVSSVALAKRMERIGADMIIAEGTESGGHVGEMTTTSNNKFKRQRHSGYWQNKWHTSKNIKKFYVKRIYKKRKRRC